VLDACGATWVVLRMNWASSWMSRVPFKRQGNLFFTAVVLISQMNSRVQLLYVRLGYEVPNELKMLTNRQELLFIVWRLEAVPWIRLQGSRSCLTTCIAYMFLMRNSFIAFCKWWHCWKVLPYISLILSNANSPERKLYVLLDNIDPHDHGGGFAINGTCVS